MRLHAALPDHHLNPDTKETVRVGMGLVATMTALLLGLLIATAKGSYDTQRGQVIQMAGKVGYLERVLTMYGPETAEIRSLLRVSTEAVIQKLWSDSSSPEAQLGAATPSLCLPRPRPVSVPFTSSLASVCISLMFRFLEPSRSFQVGALAPVNFTRQCAPRRLGQLTTE